MKRSRASSNAGLHEERDGVLGRQVLPHAQPGQARQYLVAKIRQLVQIIHEGHRNASHARLADIGEFLRDPVWRPHIGITADRIGGEIVTLLLELLGRHRVRCDVFEREHAVDRAPVRVLDDGVSIVVLRLLLARPADHLSDREHLDLATEREGLAGRRGAGIHDDRPRAAERLRIGAHPLERQEFAGEIEITLLGPGPHDGVEPFLRKRVTHLVFALAHAEHFELAFVPAHHEVQTETTLPDVIRRDELLGGDERIEQWCVDRAEHRDALGRGEQAGGPGHGLERASVKISFAAVTLPTRDRQHEIDTRRLRHAREPQAVRPARGPAFRYARRRSARRAVGAEQADLEMVGSMHRDALAHRRGAGRRGWLHLRFSRRRRAAEKASNVGRITSGPARNDPRGSRDRQPASLRDTQIGGRAAGNAKSPDHAAEDLKLRRRRLDVIDAQRLALRPGLAIANSSSLCPLLSSARSQRGVAPRPAQVSDRFFGLRYFAAILRPFSLLPRPFGPRLPSPTPRPSMAASLASSSRRVDDALSEITRTTLSRNATKSSNDIDLSFKPRIISSPSLIHGNTYPIPKKDGNSRKYGNREAVQPSRFSLPTGYFPGHRRRFRPCMLRSKGYATDARNTIRGVCRRDSCA